MSEGVDSRHFPFESNGVPYLGHSLYSRKSEDAELRQQMLLVYFILRDSSQQYENDIAVKIIA